LGALGALMVLLQGVTAGALVAVDSEPELQRILVYLMVSVTAIITVLVVSLISYFAIRNPGLLFNPQDIDSSVHSRLYISDIPPDKVAFTVEKPDSE
jgi:hypothetical protein